MGGINLKIHPLFYLFGVYYALTNRLLVFVIYTLTALLHELGHSFSASHAGYRLNKITLMPFGAVVNGEEAFGYKDQFRIAIAGPLINLCIGLLFVATWWVFPEIYAFTDIAAGANFAMGVVNLLPIFPLDGGRIMLSLLSLKLKRQIAERVCKTISIVFSVALLGLFIASIFYKINISLLFFALFVFFGAIDNNKENKYVKICAEVNQNALKRGVLYKKHGVDINVTLKRLMNILDSQCINEVVVFDRGKEVLTLSQEKLSKILLNGNLYSKLSENL